MSTVLALKLSGDFEASAFERHSTLHLLKTCALHILLSDWILFKLYMHELDELHPVTL